MIGYNLIVEKGVFEDRVFHFSAELGNKGVPFSKDIFFKTNESNDYSMFVTYESKGSFMAGREIEVSIQFKSNHINKINSSNNLVVVFPGSINYPIPETPMEKSSDGYVKLEFINEDVAYGNGSIIYYTPEYYKQSTIIFKPGNNNFRIADALSNDPKYTYEFYIEGIEQLPEYAIRKNRFLFIAPLETYLQLKTNNMIIFLTIFATIVGIIQIKGKIE